MPQRIHVIDSHTAGEPTRVVVAGGPDLGSGTMAERREVLRDRHDAFRRAVVLEPRGSDVLVGALLCEPSDPACAAGVVFFNNAGCLGMCGHGTIGLVATLAWSGRIVPGTHRIETPVGLVAATLHEDGSVSIENVPSFRRAKGVTVRMPGAGDITGDVAWGGNWFFLATGHREELVFSNVERLTAVAWGIRQAVNAAGFPEVDHVELHGLPGSPAAHARNFVLCPGKAWDRSPCGTGTSARLACLAADGELAEGVLYRQESLLGGTFDGRYRWLDRDAGRIAPTITGTAYVTAESQLILQEDDPYRCGIRPAE